MKLFIQPSGKIYGVYTELVDLNLFGNVSLKRVSRVDPFQEGWYILIDNKAIGPFDKRSQAIAFEVNLIEQGLKLCPLSTATLKLQESLPSFTTTIPSQFLSKPTEQQSQSINQEAQASSP